ncbi:hypothetical protein [Psychroserpens damuponensis]|uniref:hypothetical protein n=1 Tax=Psychroserpens damuponensis TaxID=943936 RepID=UPI0005913480|nr:hypothetical protein [Psychroserpens damuponensis]
MKLIICMFIVLISAKECDKNKAQLANQNTAETTTVEMTERAIQNDVKFNYRAITRGFYLEIWIEGDSIKYTSDNTLKFITSTIIPAKEQVDLMKLLSDIDEKMLPKLEAPSTNFRFDAAAIATLEISKDENSYKTVSFDHGNPPKSIKAIVEKMLSIKTMIEKQ